MRVTSSQLWGGIMKLYNQQDYPVRLWLRNAPMLLSLFTSFLNTIEKCRVLELLRKVSKYSSQLLLFHI